MAHPALSERPSHGLRPDRRAAADPRRGAGSAHASTRPTGWSGIAPRPSRSFLGAMAEGNWLGIAMPEEFGGAGLGITEAAISCRRWRSPALHVGRLGDPHQHLRAQSGGGVRHRGAEAGMLPPVVAGRDKACFGVTEPNAGLNTTQITTRAEECDRYVITARRSGHPPRRTRTRSCCGADHAVDGCSATAMD